MQENKDVASLYVKAHEKQRLWKAAIKWPLYSVAVMPVLLAGSLRISKGEPIRLEQLFGFLVGSVLLLLWENLTNDLFDSETGIDQFSKPHSVVALIGSKQPISRLAYLSLALGLGLITTLAIRSSFEVIYLVSGCCILGYLYQGPPFRLGYKGLGEPLCWIAFGPLATAAGLMVLAPSESYHLGVPWGQATYLGAGPAIATTLVLFCSHFHQIEEDKAHGKKSPLVRLGTKKAATLVPVIVGLTIGLEFIPIMLGRLPITALVGLISVPHGINLIKLLKKHHNQPELTRNCKFLALRFQAINGLGLCIGLGLAQFFNINT